MYGDGVYHWVNWRVQRRVASAHARACRAWRKLPGTTWAQLAEQVGPGPIPGAGVFHGHKVKGVG